MKQSLTVVYTCTCLYHNLLSRGLSLIVYYLAAPVVDVHIRSVGCEDPLVIPLHACDIALNLSYIKVNGKDYSPHGRGHNVVIVDGMRGNIDSPRHLIFYV